MNKENIIKNNEKYFMNVFVGRYPVVVDHGEGIKIYGKDGKVYYDFLAGIGVNVLGYNYPELIDVLKDQVGKMLHSSNLYYIEPQAQLEELLIENSVFDRVFFTNSGAESNEGAIKLARKYYKEAKENKYEIITVKKSFHGRTLATLAATGQRKYQKTFEPLPSGFKVVAFNNLDAVVNAINSKTAAIMIEPIQGEGGVNPVRKEYLEGLKKICKKNNILLIFDEIQCGIGRTGSLFAYEKYGVEPDIITLAKALGGGIPIGAFMAKEEIASAFKPGDHGSTFGGNHLSTRAAYTTLKLLLEKDIIENVNIVGDYFKSQLNKLWNKFSFIKDVRGSGLMLALEFSSYIDAPKLVYDLFERGFLLNAVNEHTLRFLPPLIIKKEEIDLLITELNDLLANKKKQK